MSEQERNDDLEKLRQRARKLLGHELRTPLSVILLAALSVRDFGHEFSREELAAYAQDILEAAEEMKQMMDTALSNIANE